MSSFLRHITRSIEIIRSVIGLSDGLTVPFALAAGLSSLGTSRLVVAGGIAELIAGAISMGVGGFLGSQAERDHYRFMRRQISARVQRSCAGEMEREVYGVLGPIGVDEQTCQSVTKCLRDVEYDPEVEANNSSSDEEAQMLRWKKEVGLTRFLLKFGEGMGAYRSIRMHTICTHFYYRGSIEASSMPFGADHWSRVLGWRNHSSYSILLCPRGTCGACIL